MPGPFRSAVTFLAFLTAVPGLASDEPRSATFDAAGVRLRYLTQGEGPPVILIHGLYSSAEMNWRWPGLMEALAREHRVIAIDLPGFGASDKPETPAAYGTQLVADIVLLLDHLHIDKACIIGYSMGGLVTLKLVSQHPDRVSSAILGGMGWLQSGTLLQRSWGRLPADPRNRAVQLCVHSLGDLALSERELKAIQVPVRVVVGEQDVAKRLYVEPLRSERPDWPITVIEGAGHITCLLKPEFRQALLEGLPPAP